MLNPIRFLSSLAVLQLWATLSDASNDADEAPRGLRASTVDRKDRELNAPPWMSPNNSTTKTYIVQFNAAASQSNKSKIKDGLKSKGKDMTDLSIIDGFSASLTSEELAQMNGNANIKLIEEDGIGGGGAVASWGLDRIDQCDLPLDSSYTSTYDGTNVNVFILDSGIRSTHNDFGGRVLGCYDFVSSNGNVLDCATSDWHGHGTHVAGTAAGETCGVAKNANIYSLRILDINNSGMYSWWINALNWVVNNKDSIPGQKVINMSVWGGKSTSLNNAVNNAVAAGITVVTIAGNNNGVDACNYSPSSATNAITVAATDLTDNIASFSNIGPCVDIAAPGQSIKSAINTGDSASAVWSGTSMAAPHVAGVVAQILQDHPNYTPTEVKDVLTMNAKQDGVGGVRRSRHLVLKGETQNKHDAVRRRLPKGGNTGGGNNSVLPKNFLLQTHRGDGDQCSGGDASTPEPCGGPCPSGQVCDEGSNTCVDASPPPSECTPGTGGKNDACSVNEDCSSCNCNTNNNKCSGN